MDLQGNIERFSLPEIFQLLSIGKKTGTLGVQRDDETTLVYFREGNVIFANSTERRTRLGDLLVQRELITAEQLDVALKTQQAEGETRRLGTILIETGAISRGALEAEICSQVEEIVYALLSWQSGSFKFYEQQYPTEEDITIHISTENLILEGMRRIDEMERVRATLPPFDTVLALSPANDGRDRDVSLRPNEWNVLALVDGRRSINEVIELSELDEVESARNLTALFVAGLVEPVSAIPEERSTRLEELAGRLQGLLSEYLGKK